MVWSGVESPDGAQPGCFSPLVLHAIHTTHGRLGYTQALPAMTVCDWALRDSTNNLVLTFTARLDCPADVAALSSLLQIKSRSEVVE